MTRRARDLARPTPGSVRLPVRQCLACRRRRVKGELLRWTVDARQRAVPDPAVKRPGRGGYVCRSERCLETLLARSRKRSPDFRPEENAFRVWRYEDGTVYPEPVQVTRVSQDGALISGGLQAGDLVANSGLSRLSPGQAVNIQVQRAGL